MKKLYKFVMIIFLLILVCCFDKKNNDVSFKVNDIIFAVSVNGVPQGEFPTKSSYNVLVNCLNATGKWNYDDWVAEINNITGNVSCNISFSSVPKVTFNNYIINLLGTNNSVSATLRGDGSTLEKITDNGEVDYRYRGKNPDNYIMFNGELWRIIGVFDENSHGIVGTHLVKLIRKDPIGGFSFASESVNNYPDSYAYSILNTAYYGAVNGTGKTYCYSYKISSTSVAGKCNFTGGGIQSKYQNMIEDGVNWFLGGVANVNYTSSEMYNLERGTTVYSGNDVSTSAAGVTSPIALMYPSDYGYAAPLSCTSILSSYDEVGCADSNWLKSNYEEYLITNKSSYNNVVSTIDESGIVNLSSLPSNGYIIRPVLYLVSDAYYLNGTGTQVDPYIIGKDS